MCSHTRLPPSGVTCGVVSCQEPMPVRATRVISYAHNSAVSDTVVIRATFDDL